MWILRIVNGITLGIIGAIIGFVIGLIWAGLTMHYGVFDWEIVRNCTIVVAIIAAIDGIGSADENTGEVAEENYSHENRANTSNVDIMQIAEDEIARSIERDMKHTNPNKELDRLAKQSKKNMKNKSNNSSKAEKENSDKKERSVLLEKMEFFNSLTPVYNYFLSLEDKDWLKPDEYDDFIQQFDTLVGALEELRGMLPTQDDRFNSVVDKFIEIMLDITKIRKQRWQRLSEKAHGGSYSFSEDKSYLRRINDKLIMLDEQGKKVGREQERIAQVIK